MSETDDIKSRVLLLHDKISSLKNLKSLVDDKNMSDLMYYTIFVRRYENFDIYSKLVNNDVFLSQVLEGDYSQKDKMINCYSHNRNNFYNCNMFLKNNINLDYIPSLEEVIDMVHNRDLVINNYSRVNKKISRESLELERKIINTLYPYIFIKYFNYNDLYNKDHFDFLNSYYKLYPEYFKIFRESSREILDNNKYLNDINDEYDKELEKYSKVKKLSK